MIKIALIDDENQDRSFLRESLEKASIQLKEEFEIHEFPIGREFLETYDKTYDLIFMDIDMPEKNGIEVAKELRKKDGNVLLIYVTNMAQMAIQGYQVRAYDFLLKPLNYYSLVMKMQTVLTLLNSRKEKCLVMQFNDGIHKIYVDELYYIEVKGHYLYMHTTKGVFQQKESLRNVEVKLQELPFKRCNNCYLVNLKYVTSVVKDEVQVGGEWIKMSRPKKKEFLQNLVNYMGGISL